MDSLVDLPTTPPGDVDAWVERALAELTAVADVARAGVALVEGGGRRLLFTASDRLRRDGLGWCHVDAYAPVPLNDVIGTGDQLAAPLDVLDQRYASFVTAQAGTGYVAVACIPLRAGDRVLGGFVLYYEQQQPFDARQHDELAQIGDRLGDLLDATRGRPTTSVVTQHDPPHGSLVVAHEFPPITAAVGEARRFLLRTLDDWHVSDEAASHAVLCLSELVTNAIIHTTGGCHVQIELHDDVITTRVHDNGTTPTPSVAAERELLSGDGHGLQLVDALADRWGRTSDQSGSMAWFAVRAS